MSERYTAFLRGVNVGGKNMIAMPLLRAVLEKAGLNDVCTYINSGNILFSAEENEPIALQNIIRQAIADEFGLDIPVAVISATDYAETMSNAPAWWGDAGDCKHNAIFVIAPADTNALVQQVGCKPEYEQVDCHGRVIFWSAPLKTFSRTKWSKVASSSAYGAITIRNANTAKKMLLLLNNP